MFDSELKVSLSTYVFGGKFKGNQTNRQQLLLFLPFHSQLASKSAKHSICAFGAKQQHTSS